MITFEDLVKTKVSGCAKCFSILYAIPCQLDQDIVDFFENFGTPIYPLGPASLLKMENGSGFSIEGRMKSKVIKFTMPKKYENKDYSKLKEKIDFEKCLSKWLEDKLDIVIEESK